MEVKLPYITISEDDIIKYLEVKGFKIETHERYYIIVGGGSHKGYHKIAVPTNEEYDQHKHKPINDTFQSLLTNSIIACEDKLINFLLISNL